jgi:hypothetical protein
MRFHLVGMQTAGRACEPISFSRFLPYGTNGPSMQGSRPSARRPGLPLVSCSARVEQMWG